MSETPTTTTSQKSIAIRLPFVLQYASHLYRSTFVPLGSKEREILSVLLPFVSQYASHLYCNTPPICIAVLLGKSWWLWSPGCSPTCFRLFFDFFRAFLTETPREHLFRLFSEFSRDGPFFTPVEGQRCPNPNGNDKDCYKKDCSKE